MAAALPLLPDIATLRATLQHPGAHEALIDEVIARSQRAAATAVFTARFDEEARATARLTDRLPAGARGPLAGLPVTVKDLYDIAGRTTHAGSVMREGEPPAEADAEAVRRLRAAGAAITGLTNMTEFAFSGVGLNPHHGTPRNPADLEAARIPGGSSSGAAVSVALGLAVAGLGSDTGGSIRIPAALCGLVGFKNTQARTPLQGAFPLSHTLDTVCAMARCVDDVLRVDAVLSGASLLPPTHGQRGLRGAKLLVPQTLLLDTVDTTVARAFARALTQLSQAGAELVEQPLPLLAEIAAVNAPAGLSAIEAHATHAAALGTQRKRFDPRVAARIALGEPVRATEYLQLLQRRRAWIAHMNGALQGFDAIVSPTAPIVAPEIAPLAFSDEAFFKANSLLLRNTFVANFLDGCAITLPCHAPDELPVGLMFTAPGGRDAALAALALDAEPRLRAV